MIVSEDNEHPDVSWKDFNKFYQEGYGICGPISIILFSVITAAVMLLPTFWLTQWTSQDAEEQKRKLYPLVFAGLVLFYTIVSFARALFLFKATITSVSNLLRRVTENVLRAKIVFFDSNPVGRILTRFTKDVVLFDLLFPMQSLMFLNGIFRTLSVVITVSNINPYVLIPAVFLLFIMIFILLLGNKQMA